MIIRYAGSGICKAAAAELSDGVGPAEVDEFELVVDACISVDAVLVELDEVVGTEVEALVVVVTD